MSDERRNLAEDAVRAGGTVDGATLAPAPLVRRLRETGVGADDVVLVAGVPSNTVLVAAIACWTVGAALWVSPRTYGAAPPAPASVLITGEHAVRRYRPVGSPVPPSVAVVHETSGSTGEAKLAMRSVESIRYERSGYTRGLSLCAGDAVRVPVPLVHSFGWGIALSALLSGGRVDVRPFTTPAGVAADLDRCPATTAALTPPLLRLLVATRRRGDGRPRAVLAGAGRVSDALDTECRRRFGVPVTRGYGSTETGSTFIGPRGIGAPIPGVEIAAPEAGARGELVLAMHAPVLGYLHGGEAGSRLWHTGDVVERDASGQAWFVERRPGAVRVNGKFADIGPIQAALGAVRGVAEVAFVVLPRVGAPELEEVFAVVAGDRVSREEVESAVRATTGRGLAPRLRVYPALPKTVIGKIDRNALTEWIRRDG